MTDKQQGHKLWVLRTKEEELKQRAERAEAELQRTRGVLAELGWAVWQLEVARDKYPRDVPELFDALRDAYHKAQAVLHYAGTPSPQEEAKQDE